MSAEEEVKEPAVEGDDDDDDDVDEMEEDETGEAGEGGKGIEDDNGSTDIKCQLHVRFALTVPSLEEVKALHPDIIRVTMRKQKKPKFCYLTFSTPEKAKQAKIDLSNLPYKNQGHLSVEFRCPGGSVRKDPKKWILIHGFPADASEEEMRKEFLRFGVYHCHLYRKDVNDRLRKGSAKMIFNTVKDSEAFINDKSAHEFKGHKLTVEFMKTRGMKKHEKYMERKKRRKEKRKAYEREYKEWEQQNRRQY